MSEAFEPTDRAARAGANEALFRSVNERVQELHASLPVDSGDLDFICECANESCFERIRMTRAEYESVRAHEARFAIAPGQHHLLPSVEAVVDRRERFWIVEKLGAARVVAEETDPRGDG